MLISLYFLLPEDCCAVMWCLVHYRVLNGPSSADLVMFGASSHCLTSTLWPQLGSVCIRLYAFAHLVTFNHFKSLRWNYVP